MFSCYHPHDMTFGYCVQPASLVTDTVTKIDAYTATTTPVSVIYGNSKIHNYRLYETKKTSY